MDIPSCRDLIEISVAVQFACHPEQALVAQRGIWARRFVPAHERRASLWELRHYRDFEGLELIDSFLCRRVSVVK